MNLFYKLSVGGLMMFSMIWLCVCLYVVFIWVICILIIFMCLYCNLLIIRCNILFYNSWCLFLWNKDLFLFFINFFLFMFFFVLCLNVCFYCWVCENMFKKEKKCYMYRLFLDNIKFNLFEEGVFFSFFMYFDSYVIIFV